MSEQRCQQLYDQMVELDQALHDQLTGNRVASVGTGPEQTSFFAGTQIPKEIRTRMAALKTEFDGLGCPALLGKSAPGQHVRRGATSLTAGGH